MNKKAMAAAVSMILAGGAHAAQQERPNVIVIIADDMGYSDISPFGGEIPHPQPAGDGRAGNAYEPVLHLADVGPGALNAAHRQQ